MQVERRNTFLVLERLFKSQESTAMNEFVILIFIDFGLKTLYGLKLVSYKSYITAFSSHGCN